jgi:uncharacterized FAD-dependent dehydrogenase
MKEYNEKIVIIGAGVAGINAATKLVDNGYPGELITIIDAGKCPYSRLPSEVMKGFAGAGLFSDGKWVYLHNAIGGQLAKYTGEKLADKLIEEGLDIIKRFHPEPDKIMYSNPIEEPEFIKPFFNLRMAPTWHIGTNYLHDLGKTWYNYLVDKGIKFIWDTDVTDVEFEKNRVMVQSLKLPQEYLIRSKDLKYPNYQLGMIYYDTLIYGTGKSGIDLTQKLINKYNLKKEPKSVQIGVRMELPQKYMQPIVDISYDFKLYQKPNDKVSLRTFCSNNNAAYVAEEETYNMKSFNGHSFKQENMINNMTNFGIIMEIKGIENPFEFQKQIVRNCQIKEIPIYNLQSFDLIKTGIGSRGTGNIIQKGLYYSPKRKRQPSLSSEGNELNVYQLDNLDSFKQAYGEYADYIINFISDLNKVFNFGNDYGIYIPEVKFLSEEVLVNYENLSLVDYSNIHFIGDSLSSRGIAVSAAQGLLVGSKLI